MSVDEKGAMEEYMANLREKLREKADMVNHPPHYTAGGIECIDAIQAELTPEGFAGYCKGCYAWRERLKGGRESLKKGLRYLQKLIDNYPGGNDAVE